VNFDRRAVSTRNRRISTDHPQFQQYSVQARACSSLIRRRIANKGASSPLQLPRYTGKRLPYRNLSIWRVEADAAQKSVGSRLDNYSRTWYRYPHEL